MSTRIIHQTWKDYNIPSCFHSEWINSWKELNPGWEHRFWTDKDIDEFVKKEYSSFYRTWRNYPLNIMRVDSWRLLVLKKLGGVYSDLDSFCCKPIDSWDLQPSKFYAAEADSDGYMWNATLTSLSPQNPFLEGVAETLLECSQEPSVLKATGPEFISYHAKYKKGQYVLLESEKFHPLSPYNMEDRMKYRNWDLEDLRKEFPKSLCFSYWTGSWASELVNS